MKLMNTKTSKGIFSKVNPYDLGSVARITQTPVRNVFGSARSADIYSAGGKNSSWIEKRLNIKRK